jgi:hypothetical protein
MSKILFVLWQCYDHFQLNQNSTVNSDFERKKIVIIFINEDHQSMQSIQFLPQIVFKNIFSRQMESMNQNVSFFRYDSH